MIPSCSRCEAQAIGRHFYRPRTAVGEVAVAFCREHEDATEAEALAAMVGRLNTFVWGDVALLNVPTPVPITAPSTTQEVPDMATETPVKTEAAPKAATSKAKASPKAKPALKAATDRAMKATAAKREPKADAPAELHSEDGVNVTRGPSQPAKRDVSGRGKGAFKKGDHVRVVYRRTEGEVWRVWEAETNRRVTPEGFKTKEAALKFCKENGLEATVVGKH